MLPSSVPLASIPASSMSRLAWRSGRMAYVADTWNQRIQVFVGDESGMFFTPLNQWDVAAWYGQSLENKPYLKVSPSNGHVFVADPEGFRVLEFDSEGKYVRGWNDINGFGLVSGLAIDEQGGVWVSDGLNNHLLHYTLPE